MTDPAPTRVVIAEDEAIIRLDLKETLEEEGYIVVAETGRGDEAVVLVADHKPDLAILDVKMPGQDGLSAAEQIHLADREVAILILTAFSTRDLVEKARDAGVHGYVVKPFQRADLIPAIEIALGRAAELTAIRGETETLSERLETRKVVDRAKGILMDSHSMKEADAFRWIQRSAMGHRLTMKRVSEMVIDGALAPGVNEPPT